MKVLVKQVGRVCDSVRRGDVRHDLACKWAAWKKACAQGLSSVLGVFGP